MKKYLHFFVLLLIFTGCSQTTPVKPPQWIMNPSQSGKIGAVGTANRHHKGLSYQRKLAIGRALDEMALQLGVKVSLNMIKKEHVVNEKVTTIIDTDSSYKANSTKITAHIEEAWQDPKTQELFIWLIKD